ncbi:MAG TPA: hypothetical protein DIT99_11065 [Candidatus Latescibacteria bacterium]|jgi:hypothetical protein|nr:hypothetical protein [Candidatus Latescibacterota bacterium]
MAFFRKKSPSLPRRELLRSKPIRNSRLKWEENTDGEVVLAIPRRRTWWLNLVSRVFYVPSKRTVVLDEIGSWLWSLCDGQNTVDHVITTVRERYKLERKEAEVSTLTYLKQLMEKGLIGLAVSHVIKNKERRI